MYERIKTKERVLFDKEKKEKVLHKSKGVCSHCGKKLDLESMTVDHVIPLSKGGTNELKNLVALCENCNQDKSNYVVDPEDYYIHLDWVYLKDLIKKYGEYSESVNWVSKRQIFSEDMQNVSVLKHFHIPTKGKFLVKAWYSDLNDIYMAYIRFHDRKTRFRYTKEERECVKRFVSFIFKEGCFYIYRNSSGDIALVVPVVLLYTKDEDEDQMLKSNLFIPKVLMVYKKVELSNLLLTFLFDLFSTGLKWNKELDCVVPVSISAFGDNTELDILLSFIAERFSKVPNLKHVCEEYAHCVKMLVYSGRVSNMKEHDEDKYYEEGCDRLNKFFSDLNVKVVDKNAMIYLMLKDMEVVLRRDYCE